MFNILRALPAGLAQPAIRRVMFELQCEKIQCQAIKIPLCLIRTNGAESPAKTGNKLADLLSQLHEMVIDLHMRFWFRPGWFSATAGSP